ncbi:hypothetical protein QCA50_018548 [Cerrena zonata]|uniref:Uncharacterized protein n=1 Tax=Cerrena zonata TaxID=2478898 RepID=A0AAW0FEC1_9APHY
MFEFFNSLGAQKIDLDLNFDIMSETCDEPSTSEPAPQLAIQRTPLPVIRPGLDSVKVYQHGGLRKYGFGYAVSIVWLEEFVVRKGKAHPDDDHKLWPAVAYIRQCTGVRHFSDINLREADPEGHMIGCLFWFTHNLAQWAIDAAQDEAMIQKFKDTFETDTEPKWYPSDLSGAQLPPPRRRR